jgi:HCOMODA/2-hydroxy-3-carboxy-muconic semialdehyde decarboxylase
VRRDAQDLVEAARVLAGLGLVTAYGHVSARAEGHVLITPAAIARAQPPAAFAAAAMTRELRPYHGQASWLGRAVPVHDDARLLRTPELAEAATRTLGDGEALLLRGNGAVTAGASPGLAVARMWLLAAACQVWLSVGRDGHARPLTEAEVASWRAVAPELLPRLWHHLRRTIADRLAS